MQLLGRFTRYIFARLDALSDWHSAALGIDVSGSARLGAGFGSGKDAEGADKGAVGALPDERVVLRLTAELDSLAAWLKALPYLRRVVTALSDMVCRIETQNV